MNSTVVTPVPVRALVPALLAAALTLLLLFVLAFDQGAISQTGSLLHELVHDARHLLGVPCH